MSSSGTQLGRIVREARTRAQMTLEQVAEQVGVTPGALSHIESGRRLPHPRNALLIAQVLGIPEDEIMSALNYEHSVRSHNAAYDVESSGPVEHARPLSPARTYYALPIEAMFEEPPRGAATSADYSIRLDRPRSSRDTARWSDDTAQRLEALEALAGTAAEAVRTLRGLLEDEDPAVRREARRLLRELDVRLPEE